MNPSSNGVESSLNISTPELNLPILAVGGGANTTITSGGIPVTHPHQILGTTPLSQIGCPPLNLEQYSAQLSPSCGDSEDEIDSELESNADEIGSNYSLHSGSKRQKRGILPKHATSVMRAWLFQHLVVRKCISIDIQSLVIYDFVCVTASVSNRRWKASNCRSDQPHPTPSQQLVYQRPTKNFNSNVGTCIG